MQDNISTSEISASVQLPTELLLHIFELACSISHDAALRISLVSSWVRREVKSRVFGTIVRRAGSLYPILGQVQLSHPTPPAGCGQLVRHLWLEDIDLLSSPREINLLKACPNIEDIALSVNSLRTLLSLYANPHSAPGPSAIRSLTLINHTSRAVWLLKPPRALLDNITHLRMIDLQHSPYVPIEHLPNLTHLALPFMNLRAVNNDGLIRIPENTSKCRNLTMIILTIDHYDWLYRIWLYKSRYPALITSPSTRSPRGLFREVCRAAEANDRRIHVILSPVISPSDGHVPVHSEWAAGGRGGESLWDSALRLAKGDSQSEWLPDSYPRLQV